MENVIKKINALDLSFEDSGYFEVEFCAERCLEVNKSTLKGGRKRGWGAGKGDVASGGGGDWRMGEEERSCFFNCFGKLANNAILLNKRVKRSVLHAYMNSHSGEKGGGEGRSQH